MEPLSAYLPVTVSISTSKKYLQKYNLLEIEPFYWPVLAGSCFSRRAPRSLAWSLCMSPTRSNHLPTSRSRARLTWEIPGTIKAYPVSALCRS